MAKKSRPIKDPERYIKRLKNRVEAYKNRYKWLDNYVQEVKAERDRLKKASFGERWFTYADGVTKGVDLDDIELMQRCALGREVVITGKIVAFKASFDGENSATMELKEVFIK